MTIGGFATVPGEVIQVPGAGYDIGQGNQVLVLYAESSRVTLKYTREDSVVSGYTVHIEGLCVDPQLVDLYRKWNIQGRGDLPALRARQAFARAIGQEIQVAIRDTGQFMDPRARKDWWQGAPAFQGRAATSSSSPVSLEPWQIALIAIGGALVLATIMVVVIVILKRKSPRSHDDEASMSLLQNKFSSSSNHVQVLK